MNKFNPPRAIIFDLDGTLIDSVPDLHYAKNELLVLSKRREVSMQEARSLIGDGVPKFVERAYKITGDAPSDLELENAIKEFVTIYSDNLINMTKLFPSVLSTLTQLKEKGFRLSVCTNKPYLPAMNVLSRLEISSFFDIVVGGDSLNGLRKPDAQHVLAALSPLQVTPENAVFVGDSVNDVKGARNAGIKSIVVSFGYSNIPVEELGAGLVISHFGELVAAICKLDSIV